MRRKRAVHQLVVGASAGDAIYDEAVLLQAVFREWGYESHLYACHLHPTLVGQVPHYTRCRPRPDDLVIWHYSIGSELSDFVRRLKCKVVMIYHNVTPPEYLQGVTREMARLVQQGRAELPTFRNVVSLALADSEFNRLDLEAAGYQHTGVLPIVLDEVQYRQEPSNQDLLDRYNDGSVNLLFVGRVAPNKRQDDLIKIFYYYHYIQPRSRLLLVGQAWDPAGQYRAWLERLADHLGLADCVHLTGHVSFADMVTYYRLADVFLCMSEHEGFGKPLIESMYFDIPVVAYAATAVPYTMGDAGVLIHRKDYEAIAEMIDLIVTDDTLQKKLLSGQHARFEAFSKKAMLETLQGYLDNVLQ